MKEGDDMIML